MIDYQNCTGCGACATVCKMGAITMKPSNNGFLYPIVNTDKCIKCGQCDKICSSVNSQLLNEPLSIYGQKSTIKQIVDTSTSGGAFYSLASVILNDGGVVYGAAFDKNYDVRHIRCDSVETLNRLQKSKYVQSDLNQSISSVVSDLNEGKTVLFSGTPCQCSGLLEVVKLEKCCIDNLYVCDLICHGVPSPRIWSDYIKYRRKKLNDEIVSVDFRNKDHGWRDFRMCIKTKKGRIKYWRQNEDFFMILFFHNLILRSSCHSCRYASIERVSDITLGDFWGVEESHVSFSDDCGVSVMLANTSKGLSLISKICDSSLISVSKPEIMLRQPCLRRPTSPNNNTNEFWDDYEKKGGFDYVIRKYADASFIGMIKRKYIFKFLHYTGLFNRLVAIREKH